MSVKGFLRQIILNFDFFPTTQFLRYKGQSSYRTLTGGVFTIIIVAAFFWLFASALMDILNKNNVILETNVHHHAIPQSTNVTLGPNGGFMFAISIGGMNLSRTDLKYFDIGLSLNQFVPVAQLVTSTPIPLQMCTKNHFDFNQQLANDYYNLNGSNLLCPQLNYIAEIRGRATSDIFQRLTITIKKCNTSLSSNCASDTMVQQLQNSLGYFGLGVVLVNTQLNPSQPNEYKQFYLDDKNYFPFTTTLAIKARASISQYRIWTDDSIYPYSNSFSQRGLRIPDYFLYNIIPVLSDTYAVIHFQKSCIFTTYSRSFRKIDTLFSYVGGLIGTILGFIFVLNSYNELCFKLSLGRQLCTDDDQQDIKSQNFNFLYYIGYLLYQIVKKIVCCQNKKGKMYIFTKCQQQMHKQLDIVLLMKKIIYFQRFIEQISKEKPIKQLKYQKTTLLKMQKQRQKYDHAKIQEDMQFNQQKDTNSIILRQYDRNRNKDVNSPGPASNTNNRERQNYRSRTPIKSSLKQNCIIEENNKKNLLQSDKSKSGNSIKSNIERI